VLCSDYISEAVGIASQSAAHNGLNNFTAQVLDWHSLPHNLSADVLLLSDINYDPAIFSVQQQLINHFIKTGTIVILSTPQRLMAKEFVAPLMSFCKQQEEISVSHHGNVMRITILALGKE
jgi:predicted nicotinamide N-methyase